jgi:hypothetical protein
MANLLGVTAQPGQVSPGGLDSDYNAFALTQLAVDAPLKISSSEDILRHASALEPHLGRLISVNDLLQCFCATLDLVH